MSIYGMMRTSISGMAAQAFRLTTVSDNIANADTDGYKRAGAEVTSLVAPGGNGGSRQASLYESGSVVPHVRQSISEQGTYRFTSSSTDLALDGDGFFVVENDSGTPLLTRAGSFVPDGAGNLYNSAGLYLQGYPITDGQIPNVANGYGGLDNVNVATNGLVATPSTSGTFEVNLPAGAPVVSAPFPSTNSATSAYLWLSQIRDPKSEILTASCCPARALPAQPVRAFHSQGSTEAEAGLRCRRPPSSCPEYPRPSA